jgi:hypothetical protein
MRVQEIRTPRGHWIKFDYDALSSITGAANDVGAWALYEYNSDGMLEDGKVSSGRQPHYQYEGVLMTQVSDESGRVLIKNSYERGLLKTQ